MAVLVFTLSTAHTHTYYYQSTHTVREKERGQKSLYELQVVVYRFLSGVITDLTLYLFKKGKKTFIKHTILIWVMLDLIIVKYSQT